MCHLWCTEVLANEESILQMWPAAQCQQLFSPELFLDPHGGVGGMPQGFPSSSFFGGSASHGPSSSQVLGSPPLNPGVVRGPFGRSPPPKRLPHLGVAPMCPPKLPPGAGTGYVRFDEDPLTLPPAPASAQPVNQVLPPGPPAGCATPLPVGPVIESVADQLRALDLLSSFMDPP